MTLPMAARSRRPGSKRMSLRGSMGWPRARSISRLGAFGVEEAVGVDVAAADAALCRDRPHPAGLARPGEGVGRDLGVGGEVEPEGQRAVDGHAVGKADPAGAHLARDQGAAEAGAVKEDVAGDGVAGVEAEGGDVAGEGVAVGAGDLGVDHRDAAGLAAQPGADQRLVEMVGVVVGAGGDQAAVGLAGEGATGAVDQVLEEVFLGDRAACGDGEDVEDGGAAVVGGALGDEVGVVDRAVVSVANAAPIPVADAELDGGVGLAEEFQLVEAELAQHLAEDGGRALADADGREFRGFHDVDRGRAAGVAEALLQEERRQPAGGAAADDDDARQPVGHYSAAVRLPDGRAHSGSQSPWRARSASVSCQIWSRSSSAAVCGSSIAAW